MNLSKKSPNKNWDLKHIKFKYLNYFLSSWIANLGVVPLLLFAAFLLSPALFFLFALLFFVILVNDTMSKLRHRALKLFKSKFIHRPVSKVKARTFLLFASANYLILCAPIVISASSQAETIIIARGEHKEVDVNKMLRYTIGNGEILSVKHLQKSKKLVIKGAKVGYSELKIWNKNKNSLSYQIFVLSKREHLSLASIMQATELIGLSSKLIGNKVLIKGEVDNLSTYNYLFKQITTLKDKVILEIKMSEDLIKEIKTNIYERFYLNHINDIKCAVSDISFRCQYSNEVYQDLKSLPKSISSISESYLITFIPIRPTQQFNYLVTFKIIQIEKLDGEEINLGLDHLSTNLGSFFTQNLSEILSNNLVKLENRKINISTLAQPSIYVRPNKKTTVEVGASIPYLSESAHGGQNTTWKFAGLKINFELKDMGNGYQLEYKSELTRPDANSNAISGNKESSTIYLDDDSPLNLFQISFQTDGIEKTSVPFINKVPILKYIFSSTNGQKNHKKITALISVSKQKI